jgi:hypothetical protein
MNRCSLSLSLSHTHAQPLKRQLYTKTTKPDYTNLLEGPLLKSGPHVPTDSQLSKDAYDTVRYATQLCRLLRQNPGLPVDEYKCAYEDGMTALHKASTLPNTRTTRGHDSVRLLLDHKADVNLATGGTGRTPLILACESRRWESALVLLDRGADVRIKSRRVLKSVYETALERALRENKTDMAFVLLCHGADTKDLFVPAPEQKDTPSQTATASETPATETPSQVASGTPAAPVPASSAVGGGVLVEQSEGDSSPCTSIILSDAATPGASETTTGTMDVSGAASSAPEGESGAASSAPEGESSAASSAPEGVSSAASSSTASDASHAAAHTSTTAAQIGKSALQALVPKADVAFFSNMQVQARKVYQQRVTAIISKYSSIHDFAEAAHQFLTYTLSTAVRVDTRIGLCQHGLYQEPLEAVVEYLGLSFDADLVLNTSIDGPEGKRTILPRHARHWFMKHKKEELYRQKQKQLHVLQVKAAEVRRKIDRMYA